MKKRLLERLLGVRGSLIGHARLRQGDVDIFVRDKAANEQNLVVSRVR